jgi:hypothetical protein
MTDLELLTKNLPASQTKLLDGIKTLLPKATSDTTPFRKSSSQFKSATLDVTDLTPISTAHHLLAVIDRTRGALEEASIKLRRKEAKARRIEAKLLTASGEKAEELIIDLDEARMHITSMEGAVTGALQKLHHALNQYQDILDLLGVESLTEEDFEKDQTRKHIMTAFFQALCAARAHGGTIDEGNHIYLAQLGINGAVAQAEVNALLAEEQAVLEAGILPDQLGVMEWLNRLADLYAEQPERLAKYRGMPVVREDSFLSPHKSLESSA